MCIVQCDTSIHMRKYDEVFILKRTQVFYVSKNVYNTKILEVQKKKLHYCVHPTEQGNTIQWYHNSDAKHIVQIHPVGKQYIKNRKRVLSKNKPDIYTLKNQYSSK